ncbi:glycoside hydrolase family 63 protein [Moniliophthora roreri]|nr:glycoside hydrolase family 63 protein [Moniliophthora roreri]
MSFIYTNLHGLVHESEMISATRASSVKKSVIVLNQTLSSRLVFGAPEHWTREYPRRLTIKTFIEKYHPFQLQAHASQF